jgi:enamidase
MPLGMLYTVSHLASLGNVPPEQAIAAATGSNARIYGLNTGYVRAGRIADLVLIDAPDGGSQSTALDAIRNGDIAAVGAVIARGDPQFVGRSRNSPATTRKVQVANCRIPKFAFTAQRAG